MWQDPESTCQNQQQTYRDQGHTIQNSLQENRVSWNKPKQGGEWVHNERFAFFLTISSPTVSVFKAPVISVEGLWTKPPVSPAF